MRKKVLSVMLMIMCVSSMILIQGCSGNSMNSYKEDDMAYAENNNEDAVNTLQVGSEYRIVTPMMELKEAVVNTLGDNYWPDALLTDEELAERTGISSNMYHNFMAEYQHAEAGIDMMILIEAKEDSIADVEKYLNDYRELLLKIYEKQPQNRAKVFASRIETIQNYVCYVQLGANIAPLESRGEDEMVAYCQQENERALDIIEKRIVSK